MNFIVNRLDTFINTVIGKDDIDRICCFTSVDKASIEHFLLIFLCVYEFFRKKKNFYQFASWSPEFLRICGRLNPQDKLKSTGDRCLTTPWSKDGLGVIDFITASMNNDTKTCSPIVYSTGETLPKMSTNIYKPCHIRNEMLLS